MLIALCLVRYDAALEKKLKILDIIRSLDLPNNPLDDIIDQVVLFIPGNNVEHYNPCCFLIFCYFTAILFMYGIKGVVIEQI